MHTQGVETFGPSHGILLTRAPQKLLPPFPFAPHTSSSETVCAHALTPCCGENSGVLRSRNGIDDTFLGLLVNDQIEILASTMKAAFCME